MDPLLQLLEGNALLTPDRLGQMLGVSPAEIRRRIDAWEKSGVILGYRAVINDDQLDLQRVKAVIEVRITPEREGGFDRVAERIAKFEEVTSCFLMSGGYDILIFIEGRTLQEVAAFVASKLATLDRVQSTATHFILKTYKEQGIAMAVAPREERMAVAP
ncbi:MAG: Lrp/AsnC family transcriptional regulator [Verrucomicrobiae bacterium]|nr:Lrp/AsnC family transcriptional regulator [Verrucomicrobiae bacterium]